MVIGIDLGTTNCALAEARPGQHPNDPVEVRFLDVPQLVNPGEVRAQPLLPSFLYLAGPTDFPAGSLELPWESDEHAVVGELAQKRGAENATRLVASAKSWLSHSGVNRTAAILPAAAPEGVARVSPVEASRRYLEHLRRAWNHLNPESRFEDQQVLITVPASFDAVARELTQEAAEAAGYRNVILLEEPQAAFYAWIERHPDWRERVQPGDLILVVGIDGGATDFTLIAGTEREGELSLERVAGGDHILLGGGNIHLGLGRHGGAGGVPGGRPPGGLAGRRRGVDSAARRSGCSRSRAARRSSDDAYAHAASTIFRCTTWRRRKNGTMRLPLSRSFSAERWIHHSSSSAVCGRSARFASDSATDCTIASALSLLTARARSRAIVWSDGRSCS